MKSVERAEWRVERPSPSRSLPLGEGQGGGAVSYAPRSTLHAPRSTLHASRSTLHALVLAAILGCGGGGGGSGGAGTLLEISAPVFDESVVNDFHVEISQTDWDGMMATPTDGVYRPCSFQWKDE